MLHLQDAARTLERCIDEHLIGVEDTAVFFTALDELSERITALKDAFPRSTLHAGAIKTNPHAGILKYLVENGIGLEAASFEELQLAQRAGTGPTSMVFDSPVKTATEISACLETWPGMFVNANTLGELKRYPDHVPARLGLRINPLSNPDVPDIYNVSTNDSKFGVSISRSDEITAHCLDHPISGLHVHSGSGSNDMSAHAAAIAAVVELADSINQRARAIGRKPTITWLDIGGGIDYRAGLAGLAQLRSELDRQCPNLFADFEVVTEFGNWLHATSGWVASRVEYVEQISEGRDLAFVHVGADLFLRDIYAGPRGYRYLVLDARGRIKDAPERTVDIAGPLCFAGDVLDRGVVLPAMEPGDYLLILDAGANTWGLWSRHCSRDLPKYVAHTGETIRVLSERTPVSF